MTDELIYPDPSTFPVPEDFEPADDFEDDHTKTTTGGPGGIINTPKRLHPKGWKFVEGESTPKEES